MEFVEGLRNSLLIRGFKNLVHAHKRDIQYMLFVTNLVDRWRASATDTTVGPRFIMGRWPREHRIRRGQDGSPCTDRIVTRLTSYPLWYGPDE